MPGASLLFSPRVGFNYDVMGDQTFQIRGGIGIFTSRIPWVWPAGAYTNSGVIVGGLFKNTAAIESELPEFTFNPDPYTQYTLLTLAALMLYRRVSWIFCGRLQIPAGSSWLCWS